MIKIGVTSGMLYADDNRTTFAPKKLNYMVQDMGRYLNKEGVLPILIPSLEFGELRIFVEAMDGIVLQGGADIAPETFGEEPIGEWKGDRERDLIELEILKYAMEFGKPVFGICRGFQLMNVYFGGTLYQDIPTQFDTDVLHKGADYDQNTHEISIKKNSFLYRICDYRKEAFVNSVHHQGIKTLGEGLEPIAWGEDHLVEAFYHEKNPEGNVLGVQWHPEFNWNHKYNLLNSEKLYNHFLHFAHES
ncbi:MAG: gamma-glutamyl-gamma-aminobutyrate hydrolase family protein [Cytophagales bacterium]|nr:gamma-glutamyl-gamma-aminobutyrate hydrolase family protein [Cytophagales bacterium]